MGRETSRKAVEYIGGKSQEGDGSNCKEAGEDKVQDQEYRHLALNEETNFSQDRNINTTKRITDSFTTDFGFSPILRQIIADDCIGRTLVRRDG